MGMCRNAGGRAFWVAAFASEPLETNLVSGELAPIRGWTSFDYGQREPAPTVDLLLAGDDPWRCLTLLFPQAARRRHRRRCTRSSTDARRPRGLGFQDSGTSLVIDNHAGVTTIEM